MAAPVIRSLVNSLSPLDNQSRDDLRPGDVVTVESVNTHTTYAWNIAYKPEGSTAAFTGDPTTQNPGTFTVDEEGPYLIRLIVDLGLPTEQQVSVRLRFKTVFGDLCLVAAGEQLDSPVPVPIDIDSTGWADEQNANLLTLNEFVSRVSTSGRVLYVDENDGTEGHADHDTIQAAINAAVSAGAALATPYLVAIRPGSYQEDLTFAPHVHLVGWPGDNAAGADGDFRSRAIVIRPDTTQFVANFASASDTVILSNLVFESVVASTSATMVKQGDGALIVHRCALLQEGVSPTQGPAFNLAGGAATFDNCYVSMNVGAAADRVALLQQGVADSTLDVRSCLVRGPSAVSLNPSLGAATATADFRDTRVVATAASGIGVSTDATSLVMEYCRIQAPAGEPLVAHPSASAFAGDVSVTLRWCFLDGDITFDTSGPLSGTTALSIGSSEYTSLTFPGGTPGTVSATTKSTSLFYDNSTSGITAENVQDAIDEVYAFAEAVRTLDDAYDGGIPNTGTGKRILADQGAVEIADSDPPSSPIPAGNTDGRLRVVSNVEVGSFGFPELGLDPNPFGNGPIMYMGNLVWANDAPNGSTASIIGRSTGNPLYQNYNLQLRTESADGGGTVGDLILRAGDSLDSGATSPDAGSVFIQAGSGLSATTGDAGDVWVAPGDSQSAASGSVYLADPTTATAAEITAAGAFVGGVTGTATFATASGGFTVSIDAADTLLAVQAKFDATGQVVASEAGGVITLTTTDLGPNSEIFLLDADAGVDAALGVFTGQPVTAGTFADFVRFDVSATNEITIGGNAANPMVYNADTGKLTVPGVIDPTALILDQAAPIPAGSGKGVIFVGDGSGGTVLGNFYFRHESGALKDISASGPTDFASVQTALGTATSPVGFNDEDIEDVANLNLTNGGKLNFGVGTTYVQGFSGGDLTFHSSDGIIFEVGGSAADQFVLSNDGTFLISEIATSGSAPGSYGQFWVRDDATNVPMYTDNSGDEHQLAYTSYYASVTVTAESFPAVAQQPFLSSDYSSYTYNENCTSVGVTYTPATGLFKVSNAGTYQITWVVVLTHYSNISFVKYDIEVNGVVEYEALINQHVAVSPAARTLSVIFDLSAGDEIECLLTSQGPNTMIVSPGTTFNIQRLA